MRQKPFQLGRAGETLCGKTVLRSQKVFPGCRSRYERLAGENGAFALVRIYDCRSTIVSPFRGFYSVSARCRAVSASGYLYMDCIGGGLWGLRLQSNLVPGGMQE